MRNNRSLRHYIVSIFVVITLFGCSGEPPNEITTAAADQKQEAEEQPTEDQTEAEEEKAPEIDTENLNQPEKREWFAGVYLPRHCPEAVNKGEFVIPTKDEILECKSDHYLEVRMHAEVVRSENSSEDLYGVQQYLRIFQMMEHNPTTGQFGLWGQWIGDDRARPHGPFNSIEGGLFIHDKMGRSKFPKYMASAATHLYSPLSDTGGAVSYTHLRAHET